MSDPKIKLKRSSVEGKIPTPDQVPLGELALNTYDGQLYASKNVGVGTTVIAINPFKVGTGTDSYDAYFTQGNIGIGTEVPDEPVHSSNSSVLNVGVVTANYLYGDGSNISNISADVISGVVTNIQAGNNITVLESPTGNFIITATSGSENSSTRTVTSQTATAGQTTFSVSYTVGNIDVYFNGAKLEGSEFTATNGTSVVLASGATENDVLEFVVYRFVGVAVTITGSNGQLQYHTNGTLSGAEVYYTNGNLGIGTATPLNPVSVGNTAILNVGVVTANYFYGDGSNLTGLQAGYFEKTDAGIHTLSNIGIGTTNPTDALTVSGDANVTGVVTATSFVGNLTGNATGLSGSPSITVTDITASGNVSIAGTLTYEDVTNVDSVGLITARSGIIATGVVTATSFVGDGSNLTGLATALSEFTNDVGFVTFTNNNQLTNGAGYITTSFTSTSQLTNDAGFITNVVSGVLTATSFSGDGSNLTGIQAGYWEKTDAGINTSTNIGIGTTNPTDALTVSGDANITGVVTANSFVGSAANLTSLTGASSGTYGTIGAVPVITVDANGRITGITTTTSTDTSNVTERSTTTTTATAGQTTFSVTYSVGYVDVYLNGVRLASSDFTATNGTSVVLGTAASLDDVLEFVSYSNVGLSSVTPDIVGDTTPQLGGNLDLNSNDITGTGNVNVTGITTISTGIGTVHIGTGNTTLLVQGDARVTGVLTIGQGSITLDPNAKKITGIDEIIVGTATTVSIKQNAQGSIAFEKEDGTEASVGIGTTVSVNTTGIITATSFVGDGSNLTGLATALSELTNDAGYITTSFTSTSQLTNDAGFITNVVSGILTATDLNVTGNVSIAGTLTYEDVTNVDSVGLITARSGIIATGVVTATSFSGDGSNLTGLQAGYFEKTDAGINTSSNIGIGLTNPSHMLHLKSAGDARIHIQADSDNSGENDNPRISFSQDGSSDTWLFQIGLEGYGDATMNGSLSNAPIISADNGNLNAPIQIGHLQQTVMTIKNGSYTDPDPLVGIGTNNPTSVLDVAGDANVTGVVTATSFSGDGSNLTGLQAGYFVKTDVGIHTLSNIGIGTTNPTNAVLQVEGRNFAFGGPGDNESGAGNVYIGNFDNPLLDSYDRNIRIGSPNEIQIELYTAYTATEYSDTILFASPSGIGLQYNANNGNSSRSGVYPFYYNVGNAVTDDYIYFQAGSKYLWFDGDTGRLGVNRSTGNGWSATLDVNGTARVTGTSQFDAAVTVNSGNLNLLNGNVYATGGAGSNQVALTASDGSIEITRGSGGAYIDFKNSTSEDYDARLQESSGSITLNGNTIWHAGNDGSGSGLDADTVDSIQASSFLRSDANDTATGQITLERNNTSATDFSLWIKQAASSARAQIRFSNAITTQNGYFYYRHEDGSSNSAANSFHFDSDQSSLAVIIDDTGTNSGYYVGTNRCLTTADEGSGNGIDADTVDGIQGSNFLRSDTSDEMNGTLTLSSGGTNTYGRIKGHTNDNHFITMRGDVTGSTSSPTVTAGHYFNFVEYLNTDSSAFIFKRSDTGTYTNVCTITRVGLTHVGNITAYSDLRLKENIEVIPNALEKVSTLRGVTYNRTDLTNKNRQSGVIAQEVEKVLPEVVQENDEGIKSVAYGNMVGLLIEAIKEQQSQINILKDEIKILKQEKN